MKNMDVFVAIKFPQSYKNNFWLLSAFCQDRFHVFVGTWPEQSKTSNVQFLKFFYSFVQCLDVFVGIKFQKFGKRIHLLLSTLLIGLKNSENLCNDNHYGMVKTLGLCFCGIRFEPISVQQCLLVFEKRKLKRATTISHFFWHRANHSVQIDHLLWLWYSRLLWGEIVRNETYFSKIKDGWKIHGMGELIFYLKFWLFSNHAGIFDWI